MYFLGYIPHAHFGGCPRDVSDPLQPDVGGAYLLISTYNRLPGPRPAPIDSRAYRPPAVKPTELTVSINDAPRRVTAGVYHDVYFPISAAGVCS